MTSLRMRTPQGKAERNKTLFGGKPHGDIMKGGMCVWRGSLPFLDVGSTRLPNSTPRAIAYATPARVHARRLRRYAFFHSGDRRLGLDEFREFVQELRDRTAEVEFHHFDLDNSGMLSAHEFSL